MKYRELKNYKYEVAEDYSLQISILPGSNIDTIFISLTCHGLLTIRKGYAWDGPSGPTIDTKNFMRGSLVHDALYQLIRMGFLKKKDLHEANCILRSLCREDGMSFIRALYVYRSVEIFGPLNTHHRDEDYTPIFEAP